LYNEYFTKETLQGFGDCRVGGEIFRTMNCADDLVLLAKAGAVLQGMLERLNESARYYGIEKKGKECSKGKVMRISRQPSLMQIVLLLKQSENEKYFNFSGNIITNDARFTCEMKSRIAMAWQASARRRRLFSAANLT
jgi:hypothetical protein